MKTKKMYTIGIISGAIAGSVVSLIQILAEEFAKFKEGSILNFVPMMYTFIWLIIIIIILIINWNDIPS